MNKMSLEWLTKILRLFPIQPKTTKMCSKLGKKFHHEQKECKYFFIKRGYFDTRLSKECLEKIYGCKVQMAAVFCFHSYEPSKTFLVILLLKLLLYQLPDYHAIRHTLSLAQNHPGASNMKNIRLRLNRSFFFQLGIMDYYSTQNLK